MELRARYQEAGQKIQEARALLERAEKEKRGLNTEEQKSFDDLHEAAEKIQAECRTWEKQQDTERQLKEAEERARRGDPPAETDDPVEERRSRPGQPGPERRAAAADPDEDPDLASELGLRSLSEHARGSREYRSAYSAWLRDGVEAVRLLPDEVRAGIQMDAFRKGGALAAPIQFINRLIKDVDDLVVMRQLASTTRLETAESVGYPKLDADPTDPVWTEELSTGDEGEIETGTRELRPHPLAKRVKVSEKLLRAVPAVGPLVRSRLAYKFGVAGEKGYVTGDGVRKPLGVFTPSPDGISTARDVSTDNTATDITFDGLIEAKHTLKAPYWRNAQWGFHRDAIKRIRKIKDGNGQYIWAPALARGIPDRILELAYFVSEFVPNTFTTGAYVGIVGDFSWYWIVDALMVTIKRVDELYAEKNQVGFIGRLESDGAPVLEEAFVRVQLA